MKNIIFYIVIIFIIFLAIGCAIKPKPAAVALNYNDFSPALQEILDQRITEANSNEGICIAGRVTMSDGASINGGNDVKINFLQGVDDPIWVYKDGWFVMGRSLRNSSYPGPAKLVLRAFGYDPIDASIAVRRGQMTYESFVMHKTSPEDLSTVEGVVLNDQNEPFNGANVGLSFPYASHGMNNEPYRSVITGPDGQYSFKGLSSVEHCLVASAEGYAYHSLRFTPSAGEAATKDLKLYQNRKIVIDYVYQADGNSSFSDGNLKAGTVEWANGPDGMDFSEGKVKGCDHKSPRDLEMRQDQDMLRFQIFYCNGKGNGFYDAGEVDFESVTGAAENDYSIEARPCVAGHVYIVKTYENNYAKFIVRSISGSK